MMRNDWGVKHCRRVIKRVCKEFGVGPCGLIWTNKHRSFYNPELYQIELGRKDHWKTKDILCHELAHYIHHRKVPRDFAPRPVNGKRFNMHGKTFRYYLIRVVMVMYDGCSDYSWHMEYPSIRKAWERGEVE